MRNVLKQELAKRIVRWSLLAVVILYVITGFGITEYRTVELLTFGLLSKPLSFNIHNNLIIPFIILLGLHVYQRNRRGQETKQ